MEDDDYVEVEKTIGRTRTDILTDVNGKTVAIEIQHTRISLPAITKRMEEHTSKGFYTLWLITPDALKNKETCRNLNWVKLIQKIHNVIFLPYKRQTNISKK